MIVFLLLLALFEDAPTAKVNLLTGQDFSGAISKLNQQSVELKIPRQSEPKRVAMQDVMSIEWQKPELIHAARVLLTDGTSLAIKSVTVQNDAAKVEVFSGPPLTFPVKNILILVPSPITHEEWREWRTKAKKRRTSDLLIVLKLQKKFELEGIVGTITKEQLSFTLDNEEMKVKREKIFGVQYANAPDSSKVRAEVFDRLGNVWAAESFALDDTGVQVKTQSGIERKLLTAEIARLDFSAGKVVYLSDMEPTLMQHTPYFDHAWEYRRDKDLTGATLKIGDSEFAKGLAVHSRTLLEYDLGHRSGTFLATVGIARAAGPFGDAMVRISADGKLLQELRCRANQEGQKVLLPLSNAAKLNLEVDYGERYDLGDHVIFGDARFVPAETTAK